AEDNCVNCSDVAGQPDAHSPGKVPQSRGAVLAGGGDCRAVGAVDRRMDPGRLVSHDQTGTMGDKVPQARRPVCGSGEEHLAIPAEGYGVNSVGVTSQWDTDLVMGGDVPHPRGLVIAAGGQHPTVPVECHRLHDAGMASQGAADLLM